jgi:hypothetical protein
MSLKTVAHHAYRLFRSATVDSRPRITLSKNLYFRVFPDKAVLVSLAIENIITFSLSLDALRTILDSIHLASSSGQIQKVTVEGLTIETDGRPKKLALCFDDDNPSSWLWSKPSVDYVWINVTELFSNVRVTIERRSIDQACAELAKLSEQS